MAIGDMVASNFDFVANVMISVVTQPTREIVFDRPFIFYISVKNCILFVGRVKSPKYWLRLYNMYS
mgnify:CR=1 FL=1